MKPWYVLACVLVLALAVTGCDSDDGGGPEAAVTTWNVGLARGFVDYADQRLPHVVDTAAAMDADVLCLQEVWTQEDIDAITQGAAEAYPHGFYEITTAEGGSTEPACTQAEADSLGACAEENCADVDPGELAGCVLGSCSTEWDASSAECQGCLVSNLGDPLDVIFEACTTAGGSFSYDGHNGLLLLSRHPFDATEHLVMDSTTVQRAALHATVDLPGLGTSDVYCTHLAADLQDLAYTGDHGSWAGENLYQAETLVDWIASTAATPQVFVAGDFNSGPAIAPDIEAEIPEAYQAFIDDGFSSPFSEGAEPLCTYCADNTLIDDAAPDVLIDHVFVKGAEASAERVGTDTVEIDSDQETVETHVSDHFGVRVGTGE
ncbi:MAG: endonuclease/exonuclease/phosphatase family protein [Myxococcota bacterium]